MEDANQKLITLRKRIDLMKEPEHIEVLNPSIEAGRIIYFKKINEKIKEDFRTHQTADELHFEVKDPPIGKGAETGKIWHTSLKKCIDNPSTSAEEIGNAVIDAVKKWLEDGDDGLELLQSEFPLCGHMFEEVKGVSKTSFWSGKVDAIGWYKGNYVIVEWKAVDVSEFWEKNNKAYGDYLHQCLVYARLLMLHLDLPKLPYILFVPICNKTGKYIRPSWFSDFPNECKDEIEKYKWSTEARPAILSLPSGMFNNVDELHGDDGRVQKDKKLRDVVKDDYTVKQLLHDNAGCVSLDSTVQQLLDANGCEELKIV